MKSEVEEAKQLKRQRVLASMHLKHMVQNVVNPQFKETTRWIGNPYKKNALIDYDTLPYGDQVGNQ